MNRAPLLLLLLSITPWSISTALADGTFPQPRILIAPPPLSSAPIVYSSSSQNTAGDDVGLKIALDDNGIGLDGTWTTILFQVSVDSGSWISGKYPWLDPIPNQAPSLNSQLSSVSQLIHADDLQEIATSSIEVSGDIAATTIASWLGTNTNLVSEHAQLVTLPTSSSAFVHWHYAPVNWFTGTGLLMQDYWGRAYSQSRTYNGGPRHRFFDPLALAELAAHTQALNSPSPVDYAAFRNGSDFSELLRNFTLTLQAIAVRPDPANPGSGPLPADPAHPIRIAISQPVRIHVDLPQTPPTRNRPHPTLAEILGISNPPYYAYAGSTVNFFMSAAYTGSMVRFTTTTGTVNNPINLIGPCLVQVAIPGNVIDDSHVDIIMASGTEVHGGESVLGTQLIVPGS